ncbi:hypothetical protein [Streptosporangium sp. NPDC002524]|uniref:hypothetical protein n=1 Tax=Streptosporangium sp. NPDC002524 TaxID=3154537 RepID=UPI00332A399B
MSSDLGASRWGFRERGVLTVAALLLAVSFWEWFGVSVLVVEQFGVRTARATANAWQISTVWSVAVLLGVAASLLWCVRLRGVTGRASLRPAALVFVALGILLTAWQWSNIEVSGEPSKTLTVITTGDSRPDWPASASAEEELGKKLREGLPLAQEPGYYSDVRLGPEIALFLLVLELSLMASAFFHRPLWLMNAQNAWRDRKELSPGTGARYRETRLSDPAPAGEVPAPNRPEPPPWSAPPSSEIGAVLAVDRVVARGTNVVVLLPTIRVFSTGFLLEVEVVSRQGELSAEDWRYVQMAATPFDQAAGRGGPRDSLLRMGVRFADGTKATTLDRMPSGRRSSGDQPAGPLLSWSPTGAGVRGNEFAFSHFGLWLWPLPPAEDFEFAVEWPLGGIELSSTELDGAAIVSAAGRSARYWPGDR